MLSYRDQTFSVNDQIHLNRIVRSRAAYGLAKYAGTNGALALWRFGAVLSDGILLTDGNFDIRALACILNRRVVVRRLSVSQDRRGKYHRAILPR
jgi:hypothetical protein